MCFGLVFWFRVCFGFSQWVGKGKMGYRRVIKGIKGEKSVQQHAFLDKNTIKHGGKLL